MEYNIENIANGLGAIIGSNLAKTTAIPSPLLATAPLKNGLSARRVIKNIIPRLEQLGIPIGAQADGSDNIYLKVLLVLVEEIYNDIVGNAKLQINVPPGIALSASGANSGGVVISAGVTTSPIEGSGIIL